MSKRHQQPIPRDRTQPEPGMWDALTDVYGSLVQYARLPLQVADFLKNEEAVSKVENKQLLVQRAKTLAQDCGVLTKELVEIRESHRSRRGNPSNQDDHMRCMDTHSNYMDWAKRYESVVYPTYIAISNQFGEGLGVDVMATKPSELPTFIEKESNDND